MDREREPRAKLQTDYQEHKFSGERKEISLFDAAKYPFWERLVSQLSLRDLEIYEVVFQEAMLDETPVDRADQTRTSHGNKADFVYLAFTSGQVGLLDVAPYFEWIHEVSGSYDDDVPNDVTTHAGQTLRETLKMKEVEWSEVTHLIWVSRGVHWDNSWRWYQPTHHWNTVEIVPIPLNLKD